MAKTYPNIGEVIKRKGNTAARCGCGEIAKNKVHIQYDYFRGNDDLVWACDIHKKDIDHLTETRRDLN